MYKKILVAVDGSEHSKRAAKHAVYMSSFNPEATIIAIYVSDYEKIRTEVIHNIGEDTLHIDQEEKLAPIKSIFEEKPIHYELIVKRGDPASTILDLLDESAFDLVIIGSRGLNSFQEMVLGSVSNKVVKRANAPVLIVK